MAGVRAVIFDVGNVIVPVDLFKVCTGLTWFSGMSTSNIYKEIFDSGLSRRFSEGRLTPRKFYQEVCCSIGAPTLSFEEFKDIWNSIFEDNAEIESVLESIRPGIKLLLLTDINSIHWAHISKLPVIKKFFPRSQQRVLSFRFGVRKPDERIFHCALERCCCSVGNVLYVDDVYPNVKAFQNLGGKGLLYHCGVHSTDKLKEALRNYGAIT